MLADPCFVRARASRAATPAVAAGAVVAVVAALALLAPLTARAQDSPPGAPGTGSTPTAPAEPGGGGPLPRLRARLDRRAAVAARGGSAATEAAVAAALGWLARHQRPDGRWDAAGFHERCAAGGACSGKDYRTREGEGPGAGDETYSVGVTALAALAFLGAGITADGAAPGATAEHQDAVRRAIAYLRSCQTADGAIGFEDGVEGIYNHALALYALAEASALSGDPALSAPVQRAVDFAARAQNPHLGWKYGVRPGKSDTSVTAAMALALAAAREAGAAVPDATLAGAAAWFDRATGPDGAVGYERAGDGGSMLNPASFPDPKAFPRFDAVPTMTAAATLARLRCGQTADAAALRRALAVVAGVPPAAPTGPGGRLDFVGWYAGSYALFLGDRAPDALAWRAWNGALTAALLPLQRAGASCAAGSFDPVDAWGPAGGRVYATAMNALTLEVYYRYERGR